MKHLRNIAREGYDAATELERTAQKLSRRLAAKQRQEVRKIARRGKQTLSHIDWFKGA